ncbi:Cell Division Cycle-Associated Protein 7 [Manis pentadactyla]|nr:Cell Division Cycle-Associated Protein 7 [Manis pentadactyla]
MDSSLDGFAGSASAGTPCVLPGPDAPPRRPGVGLFPGSVVCWLFLGVSGILRESLDCEAWVGLQLQRLHGKCLLIN